MSVWLEPVGSVDTLTRQALKLNAQNTAEKQINLGMIVGIQNITIEIGFVQIGGKVEMTNKEFIQTLKYLNNIMIESRIKALREVLALMTEGEWR